MHNEINVTNMPENRGGTKLYNYVKHSLFSMFNEYSIEYHKVSVCSIDLIGEPILLLFDKDQECPVISNTSDVSN